MKQKINIFIYGNYGYGNLADDIILETLLEDIDKNKKIKKKNFVVSCMDSKKVVLSKPFYKRLKLIDALEGIIPFKNIKEINNSDVFVLGGAPHLGTGPPAINELSRIFAALFLGKRVFIWGIEFGPMKGKILRFFGRRILSKVSLITVRDKLSCKHLVGLGIKSNVITCIDPVVHWNPKIDDYKYLLRKYKINPKRAIISFFPRIRSTWPVYYNFLNQKAIVEEYLAVDIERSKKTADLIDFMIEKTNAQILLIGAEFFKNKTTSDTNKFEQILSYSKYKDNIIVIDEIMEPNKLKYLLQLASIIVSERLHMIIMTRDAYIPAVGVGGIYYKIEEFMKYIKQKKRILDFNNLNSQKNKNLLLDSFKKRAKIKAELKKDFGRICKISNKNNKIIEEIAKIKPEKPKLNLFKKFLLYIIFIFVGLSIYLVKINQFLKAKFIWKNKLLYLKDLP